MAYFHGNLKYHKDTKEKRELSKEDVELLKTLQKERNTQDNCETADVRTWVIKDRKDHVTAEGHEDYYVLFDTENCNTLDLEDIYNILCYLELETDYYTGDIVINGLKFEDGIIKFRYLEEEVSIRQDNDNTDGIVIKGIDVDELISFFEEHEYKINIVNMVVNWEHQFCFLTQKAAENYLRKYGYNHHPDAHTYCICTYRDQELATLMEIIERVDWNKVGNVNAEPPKENEKFIHDTILKACEAALMYCNTYAGFDGEEPPFTNQDIKDIKLLQELEKGLGKEQVINNG